MVILLKEIALRAEIIRKRRIRRMTRINTTLILGLGNILLSDEAVGIEVIRRLQSTTDRPDVRFLDGGTLGFTLAAPIAESKRLIVVDAARMGDPPGTVRVFEGDAMDRQLSGKAKSVHEISLADLIDMARLTDTLPRERALVGIEPAEIEWGDALTPVVEAAVPHAMDAIRTLVERWSAEPRIAH
jgi:hydrogenase maturation protease